MPAITDSIDVDASAETVYELLADLEAPTRYSPAVTAVEVLPGPASGVGARRHCDLADGGFFKERVLTARPNREISMEIYEANGPLARATGTFTMAPRPGGRCQVACTMDYRMRFGPLGALMAATVAKAQFRKMVGGLLGGIKDAAESTDSAAA